jgi:hypothetical protein
VRRSLDGSRPTRAALALVCALLLCALAFGVTQAAGGAGPLARVARADQEAGCPMYPANNSLNQDISHAPLNPKSATYINSIGASGHLHILASPAFHYGMPFAIVGPNQPKLPVKFYLSPRASDPGPYPIPLSAPIQGEYSPGNIEPGDNHVLVLQTGTCKLYELYKARRTAGGWEAGSGAVFDMRSNKLRPDGWTSADAAGLPIFPLLARYPEARAGAITHALRVTVWRTQRGFIHPATHYSSSSDDPSLPPMGLRLRLKASFSLAGYHGQALIVLRGLKRYGLIVADEGGSWNIGGTHDPGWSDNDLKQLDNVPGSAFEAVSTGPILKSPAERHRGRRY